MSRNRWRESLVGALALGAIVVAGCSPKPEKTARKQAALTTDSSVTAWNTMLLNPHDRTRKGKDCGGCTVNVRIWPVQGNYQINPKHPPTVGMAVAKVVNMGTVETEMYGFKPGVDTYFVVDDESGTGKWHLVEVTQAGIFDRPDQSGLFTGCNHPPSSVANADFKTCAEAAASTVPLKPGAASGVKFASIFGGLPFLDLFQPGDESPAWTSCTEGCCTMSGQTKQQQ